MKSRDLHPNFRVLFGEFAGTLDSMTTFEQWWKIYSKKQPADPEMIAHAAWLASRRARKGRKPSVAK